MLAVNVNSRFQARALVILILAGLCGHAQSVNFSDNPLFVGGSVDPNLMFIIDDSGSMAWSYMPDEIVGDCRSDSSEYQRRLGRSPDYNKMYYDPRVKYLPPIKADGTRLPDITFTNAPLNGYYAAGYDDSTILGGNGTADLSNNFRATWYYYHFNSIYRFCGGSTKAEYYLYDTSISGCDTVGEANPGCYKRHVIEDEPNPKTITNYDGDSISYNPKENFAIWFSYYRNRMFASRAGIGEAFSDLPEGFRLGWGRINKSSSSVDGASVNGVEQGVRGYDTAHKLSFYSNLYQVEASGGTYLRRALDGAGRYYEESQKAWLADPTQSYDASTNDAYSCRQTFSILMSDGYYNGSDPIHTSGDYDSTDGVKITGPNAQSYQYEAKVPYKDNTPVASTLADVAMNYWRRDLRGDIENRVPVTEGEGENPAFWQHMVTYTVGLGVEGSYSWEEVKKAETDGSELDWWSTDSNSEFDGSVGSYSVPSDPGQLSNQSRINDMMHAALNGRGGFFTASNPTTFANELESVVNDIVGRAGSASSVALEADRLSIGNKVFAAMFDPSNWSGDIRAVEPTSVDPLVIPPFTGDEFDSLVASGDAWTAQGKMQEDAKDASWADDRFVLTFDPTLSTGSYKGGMSVPFRWANLTAEQQNDLGVSADEATAKKRLAWIRGSTDYDGDIGFRDRGGFLLGSIVNSSPTFVGKPDSGWPDLLSFGDGAYSKFRSDNATRTAMVYAGGNDGMLHGFDADTGEEKFAYIPNFIYSTSSGEGLHYLTTPGYSHRYYVDLGLRVRDVHIKGRDVDGSVESKASWRSVLFGGGRSGAKGLFAIDITDPNRFNDSDANGVALWEFTAADDARLGYVTHPPVIVQAKWGSTDVRWTAIVANGHESDTQSTGFFMLDIEGGMKGWKEGTNYQYVELDSTGDGLSPMTLLDTSKPNDFIVDRMYAGDLDGNLWVAQANGSGVWTVKPKPLFVTQSGQPITSAPAVTTNPYHDNALGNKTPNLLVIFGTGKYYEDSDIDDTATQSFYGVWDDGPLDSKTYDVSDLVEQTVGLMSQTVYDEDGKPVNAREITGTEPDFTANDKGWYFDLPGTGERVIFKPDLRRYIQGLPPKEQVAAYFTTRIPDRDPCLGGGSGWIMSVGLNGLTPKLAFEDFTDSSSDPISIGGFSIDTGMPNETTLDDDVLLTSTTNLGSGTGEGIVDTDVPTLFAPDSGLRGWQELIQ